MINIGSYNQLTVMRKVDFGFYLGKGEDEVLLPAKYAPENLATGDSLKVFVYTDSEDRPVATTLAPHGAVGDFALLTVREITGFGAFMDWGLEKDLLIPKTEQRMRLRQGEKHVVKICLDKVTDRVFGSTKIGRHCQPPPDNLYVGQKVSLLIYDVTDIGISAVVDNSFSGMLYKNETFENLTQGDLKDGYIQKIRDDGKIDLSLRKPGYKSVITSSEIIIKKLEESDGFLPCHDKTSPEEIRQTLSMSKKEFKRAIGGLYKEKQIDITENGIRIRKKNED